MGYTHYWDMSKDSDKEDIKAMMDFTRQAIEIFGKEKVAGWDGEPGTGPEITEERVSFNGVEEESHESFVLEINTGEWSFCKTARKPYDSLVVACLVFADESNIVEKWSSDGDLDDHQAGRELYRETLKKMEV